MTIRAPVVTIGDSSGTIRALWGWLFGSLRGLLGGDYKGSTGDYLGVSAPGLGVVLPCNTGAKRGIWGIMTIDRDKDYYARARDGQIGSPWIG